MSRLPPAAPGARPLRIPRRRAAPGRGGGARLLFHLLLVLPLAPGPLVAQAPQASATPPPAEAEATLRPPAPRPGCPGPLRCEDGELPAKLLPGEAVHAGGGDPVTRRADRSGGSALTPTRRPAPRLPPSLDIGADGEGGPSPENAALLSMAVPGAGQYLQGRRRWIGYAAAEVLGWILVLDRRSDGRTLRQRYRDLAWTVAREGVAPGPRMDGDFAYYETLSDWVRSGRFDRDAAMDGIQPETDPDTYNGAIWTLARDLFLPPGVEELPPGDPRWARALAYYESEAYGSDFLWDWSSNPGERSRFAGLIEESDDRFRHATLLTGAVVANHLLSAVDAFVSGRLSAVSGMDVATRVDFWPPGIGATGGPTILLSLHLHP